jgi:hypothetical protein
VWKEVRGHEEDHEKRREEEIAQGKQFRTANPGKGCMEFRNKGRITLPVGPGELELDTLLFFLDNNMGFCYTVLNSFARVPGVINDCRVVEGKGRCRCEPGQPGHFCVWVCGLIQGCKGQVPEVWGDIYFPGGPGSISAESLSFFALTGTKDYCNMDD